MFTDEHVGVANAWRKGTLAAALGMEFSLGPGDGLVVTMPVDERTFQPMRQLHGGATAALAETLGSVSSALLVDRDREAVVGLELNINHLRAVRSGRVTATGTLLHRGRRTHVWDIRVVDDGGEPVAASRITILILQHA